MVSNPRAAGAVRGTRGAPITVPSSCEHMFADEFRLSVRPPPPRPRHRQHDDRPSRGRRAASRGSRRRAHCMRGDPQRRARPIRTGRAQVARSLCSRARPNGHRSAGRGGGDGGHAGRSRRCARCTAAPLPIAAQPRSRRKNARRPTAPHARCRRDQRPCLPGPRDRTGTSPARSAGRLRRTPPRGDIGWDLRSRRIGSRT
jgi:hypothetical protein